MNRDRLTMHLALGVAMVLLLYLASPPFVLLLCNRLGKTEILLHQPAREFFAPAEWLYFNFPPYERYIFLTNKAIGAEILPPSVSPP